jgi:hypothetical protein
MQRGEEMCCNLYAAVAGQTAGSHVEICTSDCFGRRHETIICRFFVRCFVLIPLAKRKKKERERITDNALDKQIARRKGKKKQESGKKKSAETAPPPFL